MSLRVQFAVRLLFTGAFYCVLAIGPTWLITDSFDWPRGWLAIGVLLFSQALIGAWMLTKHPDLLESRMKAEGNSTADKLATALIVVLLLGWYVANPLDVHALQLFPPLSAAASIPAGLMLFAFGMGFILWTVHINTFATSVVAIQDERGQQLIDTGPYARVRHPMYAGLIPALAGLSLIMGSSAVALGVFPMVMLGFLPRILIEEVTLRQELDGYDDYMRRVRWRLIPGVM